MTVRPPTPLAELLATWGEWQTLRASGASLEQRVAAFDRLIDSRARARPAVRQHPRH